MKGTSKILVLFLIIILSFSIVACGKQAEKTVSTTEEVKKTEEKKEEVETKEETKKDELIISMGATAAKRAFDPMKGWGTHGEAGVIHSTLLKKDKDISLIGDLAKDYTISEDGLKVRFNLNDNFKFSNGEPVTAEDVKFTYDVLRKDGKTWDLTFIDEIKAVDDTSVEFILSEPRAPFVELTTEVGILPHKHYDPNTYSDNPIGSGVYMVTQFDKDQQVIFESNPHYAGPEPYFKKWTLLLLDDNTALSAAKAGEVDMINTLPEFANIKIDGWKLINCESIDVRGLLLPVQKPGHAPTESGNPVGNEVTSDPAIRHALFVGLDRQSIIDIVFNGYAEKTFTMSDTLPWNNSVLPEIDNDVEAAKKILEDAGWVDNNGVREKNGIKAEFDLYYASSDEVRANIALIVAEQAEKLGIKMNLVGSNWDEMEPLLASKAIVYGGGRTNPNPIYTMHHPKLAGQGWNNPTFYDNPKVNEYLEAAMHAKTEEEALQNWKNAHWDGETGIYGPEDMPFVWLVRFDHLYLGRENINVGVQPLHSHGHEWGLLANIGEWTWED